MTVRVNEERTPALDAEDRELVDLLAAVLVDPNLHTDRIMRLYREVRIILRAAHQNLYGEPENEVYRDAAEGSDDHLPDLLAAVPVDPNLYTDLRMRLHREIRVALARANTSCPA